MLCQLWYIPDKSSFLLPDLKEACVLSFSHLKNTDSICSLQVAACVGIAAIKWKALAFHKIHSTPNPIKIELLKKNNNNKKWYINRRFPSSPLFARVSEWYISIIDRLKNPGNRPFLGLGIKEWFGVRGGNRDYFNQQSIPIHSPARHHNLGITGAPTRGICTYQNQENQVLPLWQLWLSEWVFIQPVCLPSPFPRIRIAPFRHFKEDRRREGGMSKISKTKELANTYRSQCLFQEITEWNRQLK